MHMRPRVVLALALVAWAAPAFAGAMAAADAGLRIRIDAPVADVVAAANPREHYALYLPRGYPGGRRWPLLIILDPRGRAELGLQLALEGARRNGWIVMSAAGSRSDAPQAGTLAALQALLVDADQRFAIDPHRLYLAGMSGTAKTLWDVLPALRPRIAGLIACAGAPDGERPPAIRPPAFAGCTGTRDFNHWRMQALDRQLAAAGVAHRLDVFRGVHGWIDAQGIGLQIDWLEALAQGRPLAPAATGGVARKDGEPGKAERALLDGDARYQRRVDAWFTRMQPGFDDSGARRRPPPLSESLRMLDVPRLRVLAADPEPARADAGWRRLALARAASAAYLPAIARARGDAAMEGAALAVAAAIGPIAPD